ncbi:MAG: cyclase [Rhizobacter sp.]|nr:cyclase [Rhizobacter sp.]
MTTPMNDPTTGVQPTNHAVVQASLTSPSAARDVRADTTTPSSASGLSPAAILGGLAQALAGGQIRVIDLTHTLTPEFPAIALPPEFGQCWPFRVEEVSRYDERGPSWYWNNFSCGEHTGTHFDAPIHWISGRDLPHNSVDTIPVQNFVAPAVVIDCSAESAADPDHLLTTEAVLAWEAVHGRIPSGAWVLMRTDWSKRAGDPEAFQNYDETGQHTPGPSAEVARFLVEQRNVLGFGSEAIGTDAGQGYHQRPPYPCHYYMHGAGRYGLQCLTNLDLLPPTGAVLICPPLKIEKGSGSPLRVLALVG